MSEPPVTQEELRLLVDRIDAISRRFDGHVGACWWRFAMVLSAIGIVGYWLKG